MEGSSVRKPLARAWSHLTWADMAGYELISNGLCKNIRDDGFQPILEASTLMVRNTASILSLVRAGAGVTILPELAILPEFLDLEFLPLQDCSVRREVWMLSQPDALMTPAARALLDCIKTADLRSTRVKIQLD